MALHQRLLWSSRRIPFAALPRDAFSAGNPVVSHGSRSLATSAQKRKWKRQNVSSKKQEKLFLEDESTRVKSKSKEVAGNPFLFLVVFPVAMAAVVVFLREDLRDELKDLGAVQRFRNLKSAQQSQGTDQ